MIKLDDDLLRELGLASLPPEEKKKLLAHIYETLEMRVGMKLAEQMSDAQLSEFEQFIERNDEAGALQWLESNFPNYKDVVASEFEALKAEIRQVAPQILSAPRAAGPVPQPGASMPPQPTGNPYQPQPGMPRPGAPMPPQPPYGPTPETFAGQQPWQAQGPATPPQGQPPVPPAPTPMPTPPQQTPVQPQDYTGGQSQGQPGQGQQPAQSPQSQPWQMPPQQY